MNFSISGLSPEPFQNLYGLSESELAKLGARRYIADDEQSSYSDRIEMRHAKPGESILLVNYLYQPANTPYRASHAIYVIEGAKQPYSGLNEIPDVMRIRLLSLRAFNSDHMMIDADIIDGTEVESLIERLFASSEVSYIQAHYAKRGCYAGRIDRV